MFGSRILQSTNPEELIREVFEAFDGMIQSIQRKSAECQLVPCVWVWKNTALV